MIELIAYDQKPTLATDVVGDQWTLDITQPGAISLKYEVSKGNDIMGRYSPFSQTFRLPFTNYNSRFFGLYYDVNLTQSGAGNVFNIHKKSYCEIRVDGIPIITGSLQLKNVHTKSKEYEVAVFGEEASIFQEIKDKKLIDLFISEDVMDVDYDVPLTPSDIVNSWTLTNDVTTGNVGDGTIVFPLADYGLSQEESSFLYYDDGSLEAQGIAQENFLQPYMFKPAISVSHLFEKIFTQAGYTLKTNSFLTSDAWTKLYMTLATDRESVATRGVAGLCVSHTPATSVAQVNWGPAPNPQESAGAYEIVDLNLDDTTGVGVNSNPPALFDAANNWKYFASIDSGYFDVPDTGIYYGTANLGYETNLTENGRITMRVQKLSPGQASSFYQYTWSGYTDVSGVSTGFLPTFEWFLPCDAGDRVYFQAEIIIYSANQSGDYIRVIPEGTFFTVYASDLNNGIAQMPNNMPDVQQSAFVKDLAQRFNLCITSDNNDVKQLNIQPWQDYIDAGDRKDWTDKLDTSKEFTIKPTDSIRNKFLHFEDAEDDTIFNKNFQDQNQYVIGRYKQEVGQDFTSGTLKNDPIFAPFQVGRIPKANGTDISEIGDVLIHKGYGQDTNGPISSAKPKLFYHNGVKTLANGASYYIEETSVTTFPLCVNFYNNGNEIASDSPYLMWSFNQSHAFGLVNYGATPSDEGYFARYHQQFLMSIYGQEARLVECEIMLSPTDIFNFKFNDEIIIKNTAYRVLTISNYQPFANVPCKVTLLKKLDAFKSQSIPQPDAECELVVAGLQQNGFVLFINPETGVTSNGTEECCNENHYTFNTTLNACMWATGNTGGGNGLNDGQVPGSPIAVGKSLVSNLGGVHAVKNQSANHNPIPGEISIQGQNVLTGIQTTQKNVVLYATTYSNNTTTATPTGNPNLGKAFALDVNMSARIIVRALSIQTDDYFVTSSVGSPNSTSFKVYTFMAKNLQGTISITGSEQTDFAQEDTDAGSRVVECLATKGTGSFDNTLMGFVINVTGPTDTICAWNLDCSITFMSTSTATMRQERNLLLLENLGDILSEDGLPLVQE